MDEVELKNLQFLGVYGIIQETWKLIHQFRKIFIQITLAFILPLSLFFITNMEISIFFLQKITQENMILQDTEQPTPEFLKLSDLVSTQKNYYVIFNITSLSLSLLFSLLSPSAVVYTVACIYSARAVSFDHVIRVLPRVWKRLRVTFFCTFAAFIAFNFVAFAILFLVPVIAILIYGPNDNNSGASMKTLIFFFVIFYCVAIWYLSIIWQLSNAVSVLEDSYGFKAMTKSKALLNGNVRMVTKLSMCLNLPLGVVQIVFYHLVVRFASSAGVPARGILGIIWVLAFLLFFLFKLVAETVVYFVCKLNHCESIDKLALSDHLQGYLMPGYVRLKVEDDVQLEKLQVV